MSQISLPWQRRSVGEKYNRWPIPENPPIGAKISRKSLTRGELQPILSQILLPWQPGSLGGKCNRQHSMAHPRKITFPEKTMAYFRKHPYRRKQSRKNFLRKPSYSQFCPKFRCHGNGGRSGENAIGSIRWPIPKNPPIGEKSRKNLSRKPSYSPFCFKFRCHGNQWKGKGTGKENEKEKG